MKPLARTVSVVCVLTAVAGCASSAPPVGPGAVRWRWRPPSPASVGMPAGDQSNVTATYGHLRLVLFSPAGSVQWQAERLGLREEAPLLLPDVVVAPADDGLVAVDRVSGHIRWDTRFGEESATPVRVGGLVVTCTAEGSMLGLDITTGRVMGRVALGGGAEGPPAVIIARLTVLEVGYHIKQLVIDIVGINGWKIGEGILLVPYLRVVGISWESSSQ